MSTDSQNDNQEPAAIEQPIFWGFARLVPSSGKTALRFVWKRIIVFFVCVVVLMWIFKSAAIFGFFKYTRGYTDITVADALLFPMNRAAVTVKFGEKQLAEAKNALAHGDYQKAVFLLRTGLGRSPKNRDARLTLANIMNSIGEKEVVLALYQGGLTYHSGDPLYMKAYLQTLLNYRMDKEIRDYAAPRLNAIKDRLTDADRVTAFVLAQEEEANGRFSESLSIIKKYYLAETIEGSALQAKNHWRSGDRNGAIALLNRYITEHPQIQPEGVYQTLYSYYVELGRNSDAKFCALNHVNNAPRSPVARRELIECYDRENNTAKVDAEIRSYLRSFPHNPDALIILSDYAMQSGNEPLANDIYALGVENSANNAAFCILTTDTCLSAGNYTRAIKNCDSIESDAPGWLKRLQEQIDYLRMIAAHAQHQESVAQIHLDALLNSDSLEPANMLAMSRRIRKLGMDDDALTLLEHANKLAPDNEEILAEIVSIDLDNNLDSNFVENVDSILSLRSPGIDLLKRIRPRLSSDHFIFDAKRDAVLAKLDKTIAGIETFRKSL
jgi:hypothetical protein